MVLRDGAESGRSLTSCGHFRVAGILGTTTMTEGAAVEPNVAQQALAASNLAQAIRMRVRGAHWREIADSCGYSSPAAALKAVGVAMADATMRADMTADQMRDEATLQYDSLLRSTMNMLDESAPYDADGVQPDDRAVRLRAVDEARRLIEAKTKLNRLDQVKDEPTDDSGIRIIGVAVKDIV